MAGILDKKERFVDFIVTQEGKRQMANGELRVEYASATDCHIAYAKSEFYDEVCDKIYFEVAEKPENAIVLEKDDSGRLIQKDVLGGVTIEGDKLFHQFLKNTGQETLRYNMLIATGSQFTSLSNDLIENSIKHFKKNQFIASSFGEAVNKEFQINKREINYTISNSIPFPLGPKREVVNIDNTATLVTDKNLAHLPNFQYLPPNNLDGTPYGSYTDIRNLESLDFDGILKSLGVDSFSEVDLDESIDLNTKKNTVGNENPVYNREDESDIFQFNVKERETIKFLQTSEQNNLLIQLYELGESDKYADRNTSEEQKAAIGAKYGTENTFIKLDIIDGGIHFVDEDINGRIEKQVYYAGKIYYDSQDLPHFLNIFTLIFD